MCIYVYVFVQKSFLIKLFCFFFSWGNAGAGRRVSLRSQQAFSLSHLWTALQAEEPCPDTRGNVSLRSQYTYLKIIFWKAILNYCKGIYSQVMQVFNLILGISMSTISPNHGQTLANRTKPGQSLQLQMWVCIYILEFYTHLQNGLTYSWKLVPNKF